MKDIDFLPNRYRQRALKRKAAIWQYAILLGFGSLLVAASCGQYVMKRSLRASLAELERSRIDTNLKRERVKLLKQQVERTEQVAALYTYLRHPWPRTQLIARIAEPLPERIVLEAVEIIEQPSQGPAFPRSETGGEAGAVQDAASDLAQLRRQYDAAQLVVRIRGTVDDTAALNEYVRKLGQVPLFRSVSLTSLQSQTSGAAVRSRFEVNVTVRPGHGQPGGPGGPLADFASAMQPVYVGRNKQTLTPPELRTLDYRTSSPASVKDNSRRLCSSGNDLRVVVPPSINAPDSGLPVGRHGPPLAHSTARPA